MIKKELLKNLISDQREIFLDTKGAIQREVLENGDFKRINAIKEAVIITGVRRSGKSFLLRLIWEKIKQGSRIHADNFLYFNFENEKLLKFEADDFDSLLDSFNELYGIRRNERVYLFFDEIQNIFGWEKFINRLLEERRYKIYITGSNASLLSREIGTALTGRNYPLNLFPLSFSELALRKLGKLDKKDIFSKSKKSDIQKIFKSYMENGGFPEVVIGNFRPILQEYLKNIIYRDIVLRRKIKSEINLREIVSFISSNIGLSLSYENIGKMTEIKNIMTVKNYVSYLLDSFLFLSIPRHSYSVKKQIYNPDKMYLIDPGLYYEVANISSPNRGRVLENMVLIEMKRRGEEVYYFSGKKECDFLIIRQRRVKEAVQVTESLDRGNRDREVGGLIEAMEKYKLKKGLILTNDDEDEIKIGDKTIIVRPAFKWFLNN